MIQGNVLSGLEAMVRLRARGMSGQIANIEAMIDSGFNDAMALPSWVIEKLALKQVTATNYMLADGVNYSARVFMGEIDWHGIWREILIVDVESDPLLGMAALEQCNLSIDVVTGGSVIIRPLKS